MAGPVEDIQKLRLQLVDLAVAVESCPAEDLGELLSSMQQLQNSFDELRRRAACGVARSGVYALDGFRSPGRWVALHTGLLHSAASRLVRESKTMTLLRYASEAALEGVLNDAHVAQLVRCHSASPDRFDEHTEAAFTELAATGDFDGLAVAVREWVAAAEATSEAEPPVEAERASFKLVVTFDGWWHGELRLSPDDGALVRQAIERRVGRMLNSQRQGGPSSETLSIHALRAQALVDLADADLRSGPGQRSRPDRYHIALTMNVDADGNVAPVGSLPAGALCDAAFYRLVLGPEGQPLDIGRTQRSWPAPLATAIIRRDQHCRFPGCDAPPAHCDIHHCKPWEHGGHTTITNGLLLCRWHHTFLHSQHWTVELDEHQQPEFRNPTAADTNSAHAPPHDPHPRDSANTPRLESLCQLLAQHSACTCALSGSNIRSHFRQTVAGDRGDSRGPGLARQEHSPARSRIWPNSCPTGPPSTATRSAGVALFAAALPPLLITAGAPALEHLGWRL